jgi:hypothetical protein
LPIISYAHLKEVIIGGCAVAMVAFADTSVLSRTYAAKTRTPVDPNQEMIGLGAANLAAGLFPGFPISSSSSRTPVAEAAGAKTQLTGVVGAIAVALLLVFAPNLLKDLPSSGLAAVVIAAAIGLFEFADLRRIFRIQPWEFWLSIACFIGVAVFGVIPWHRHRDRHRGDRVPMGRLAATLRGARPSRWCSGLPRRQTLSRCAPHSLAWCCFVGTHHSFSPTPSSSTSVCSKPSHNRRLRCGESSSRPSPSPALT